MNENEFPVPEEETQGTAPVENAATEQDATNRKTVPESRPRRLRARRTLAQLELTNNESGDIPDIYTEASTGVFEDSLPQAEEIAAAMEETERAEQQENTADPDEDKLPPSAAVFDWIKSVLLSFAVVIFTFTVLFRGSTVVGNSMMETLHSGERVIISDFLYTPASGDIVVVHTPTYKNGKDFLIKRVIAVSGQTVKINFNSWQIWVDGNLLEEPYVLKQDAPMIRESLVADENGEVTFTVKEDHVFVMGDNRNDSLDSRSDQIGQINRQYILGKVILRYLPFSAFGPVA